MSSRHFVRQLLVLVVLLHLVACCQKQQAQKQGGPVSSDLKEIRATIGQISKKMDAAVLANDYETQLSYCTDDILIDHPLEPPVRGKAALRESQARGERG